MPSRWHVFAPPLAMLCSSLPVAQVLTNFVISRSAVLCLNLSYMMQGVLTATRNQPRELRAPFPFDVGIVALTALLVLFGLVMIYSTTAIASLSGPILQVPTGW